MKGISFIVIMSIVWSVVSAIIEKRQKAKQQLLKEEKQNRNIGLEIKPVSPPKPKASPVIAIDPEIVQIESLRRKRTHLQQKREELDIEKVEEAKRGKIPKLQKLHKEGRDLPPAGVIAPKKSSPAQQIAKMLQSRRSLRTAIVLSEIVQKPLSLR
ncbi:MAG: hypothetical protein VX436_01835 [Planctomycetota bacterium]|nr:hypothetical protein [Planctomycetota bacterium]